jgi:hypothetical protein
MDKRVRKKTPVATGRVCNFVQLCWHRAAVQATSAGRHASACRLGHVPRSRAVMGLKVDLPKQVRVQVDGSTGRALKLVHDWLPLAIMAAYTVQQLHGQAFLAVDSALLAVLRRPWILIRGWGLDRPTMGFPRCLGGERPRVLQLAGAGRQPPQRPRYHPLAVAPSGANRPGYGATRLLPRASRSISHEGCCQC